MRRSACLLALFACLAGPAAAAEVSEKRKATVPAAEATPVLTGIDHYRALTWRWQRLMGKRLTPTDYSARETESKLYRRWVLRLWQRRAVAARRQAQHPPGLSDWLCIHRYEGGWDLIDGPYYGGLQMDMEFQRTYGSDLLRAKGTADNWTPLEQWPSTRTRAVAGTTRGPTQPDGVD
jgi:hypothetical protein